MHHHPTCFSNAFPWPGVNAFFLSYPSRTHIVRAWPQQTKVCCSVGVCFFMKEARNMTEKQKEQLTRSARRLYGELNYLFDYWRDKKGSEFMGSFFVSTTQLIRVMKYSLSTLIRARRQLITTNLIVCAAGNGRGKAITYHLPERTKQIQTNTLAKKNNLPTINSSDVKYLCGIMGTLEAVESYVQKGYDLKDILKLSNAKA